MVRKRRAPVRVKGRKAPERDARPSAGGKRTSVDFHRRRAGTLENRAPQSRRIDQPLFR